MGRKMKFCNHIKVNGECCGAFPIRNSEYCYFHERMLRRERNRLKLGGPVAATGNTGIKFDPIEDTNSLLLANNEILYALMDQRIDNKRAALMLYSLQISAGIIRRVHMTSNDPSRIACDIEEAEDESGQINLANTSDQELQKTAGNESSAGPRLLACGDASR